MTEQAIIQIAELAFIVEGGLRMNKPDFIDSWMPAFTPPDSEAGKWSRDVVAVTNYGNVHRVAASGEVWQRTFAFEEGEQVVHWIDFPFLD